MSSIDRSDPVILSHVLAEHRDLFHLMSSARAAFAASAPPTAERRLGVLESLRGLRAHLAEHFLQEEQGGFLEEAVTRVPRLSAAVREIVGQHPRLLAQLDAVIERLAVEPFTGSSWDAAADGFTRFATQMAAHERSENAVVQEGYNEDLGLVE
jgi:hypothetical protein